jgi:hypothetical protein
MPYSFFARSLLYMAIEREIRHQALQLGILLMELPQFVQFTQAKPRTLAIPHIKYLLLMPICRHTSTTVVPPLLHAGRPESVHQYAHVIVPPSVPQAPAGLLFWFWVTGSLGTNKGLDT